MTKSRKQQEPSFVTRLTEGCKYTINDKEHGSKAIVPIQIDSGTSAELVQLDAGLITHLPKGKSICDNLIYTVQDTRTGLNVTWLIELKGTAKSRNAKHSITQIVESIQYMQDQAAYPQAGKYLKNRDYIFAAVAGAPDKTLPVLNNEDLKNLCKKLKQLSGMRKNVKDMFTLFCYIQPNPKCQKAETKGLKPPYNILCYNQKDGYIPYPSMLKKLLQEEGRKK